MWSKMRSALDLTSLFRTEPKLNDRERRITLKNNIDRGRVIGALSTTPGWKLFVADVDERRNEVISSLRSAVSMDKVLKLQAQLDELDWMQSWSEREEAAMRQAEEAYAELETE